jgi:hypothetical protein
MDQNRLDDFLSVAVGYSASGAGPAVLAAGFTSLASGTNGGHIRLITTATPSTSTSNGSELSGGSYTQKTGVAYSTGSAGAFTAPAFAAGQAGTQTNVALSQTGMPAANTGGIELWDSTGGSPFASALRWWWGAFSTFVTTNSGDTLTFNSGAIAAAMFGPNSQ